MVKANKITGSRGYIPSTKGCAANVSTCFVSGLRCEKSSWRLNCVKKKKLKILEMIKLISHKLADHLQLCSSFIAVTTISAVLGFILFKVGDKVRFGRASTIIDFLNCQTHIRRARSLY